MITKVIKFDINKNLYNTLIAKQGDTKSRFLLFNLLDGSIPFSLENRSVRVYAVKPDRTEVFNDLIITDAAKGYCILELTTQMLAVAGTVRLELMVIEEEKKLTSNIFYMDVKESINSEKAVVSTNEFGALLTALSSLNEYDNYKREIAAARDGEANLLTKVKKIDEQLEHIATEYNVKDYGAKGDDKTDDSDSIRRCIADLPNSNFILKFPEGIYIQGDGTNPHYSDNNGKYGGDINIGEPIYFDFTNKSNFKIIGYGATIKSHPNNSCIANNRGFSFSDCDNLYIEGITYDGNKNSRQPWGGDNAGYNLQSAFYFSNCDNINLFNVVALNSVMDGFTFRGSGETSDTYCNNIIMTNCKSKNAYRQGISGVNAHYGTLYGCEFSDTGKDYGTSPMFGIDLEQGYTNYQDRGQKNWSIRDCIFKDNIGQGLGLHWGTYNALVEGNTFINNGIFCPKDAEFLTVNNTIRNNVFYDAPSFEMQGGGALVENNTFYVTNYTKIFITDVNNAYGNGKSRRNVFRNNTIISDLSNVDYVNKEVKSMNQTFFNDVTDVINNDFVNMYFIKETSTPGNSFNINGISELSKFEDNRFIYNVDISTAVSSISLPKHVNRNNNEYASVFNIGYRRPEYTTLTKKAMIFDETLNKAIWWNGTNWVDGVGNTIS